MPQAITDENFRSIRFETADLPRSLMSISILIVIDDFSERTGDWIWSLPHCNGLPQRGAASWCDESATEIINHLLENRSEILMMIEERLGPSGFDPAETFAEWMASLVTIQQIASTKEGDCTWIAEMPGCDPRPGLERATHFLDSLDSSAS